MKFRYTPAAALGVLSLATGGACLASRLPGVEVHPFQPSEWTAASDERLAGTRGGFDLGSGLKVSFGIARTVLINGEVLSRTSFMLPDIGKITADQAAMARAAMGGLTVVQNGPGNFVAPDAFGPAVIAPGKPAAPTAVAAPVVAAPTSPVPPAPPQVAATVIQNSLNNQVLQHMTMINTGVNSLGLLKQAHIYAAMQDALLGALGQR
jgi:hypothetical protein